MPTARARSATLLAAALLGVCGGCGTHGGDVVAGQGRPSGTPATSAPGSSPGGQPGGANQAPAVLRFRPVLQEAPATGGPAAGATGVPSPAPGAPVTQDEAAGQFAALTCGSEASPTADGAADYRAACAEDGSTKYLLGPAVVSGSEVSTARAHTEPNGEWGIELTLDPQGSRAWATYTATAVGSQVAITVDGRVLSAPTVQGAIDGPTEITGNFTQDSARALAQRLGGG